MNNSLVFLCLSQIYLLFTIGGVNGGHHQGYPPPAYNPYMAAPQPPMHMPQPQMHMPQPQMHVPQPHMPPPQAYMAPPAPHYMGPGGLAHSPSHLGHSGVVSHGTSTQHKVQYTHTETFTQADNVVMNQYNLPSIAPALGHFHSLYRGFNLKLKSKLKSNKISDKALTVLRTIHTQPGYLQAIHDIGQHQALRHAILGSFGYPCAPDVYSAEWGCSYDCYYQLVCSLHGDPYLLRKFFIVIKNCPGMLTHSYTVNQSWVNKITHHTTTTTTHTASTESHMTNNQHSMGYNGYSTPYH